jgi:hypothetical protein
MKMNKLPSPKELDDQATTKIDKWLDMYSEDVKLMDDNHELTLKWFKMFFGNELFNDSMGRLWFRTEGGLFNPYHFVYGKSFYGYRVAKLASN